MSCTPKLVHVFAAEDLVVCPVWCTPGSRVVIRVQRRPDCTSSTSVLCSTGACVRACGSRGEVGAPNGWLAASVGLRARESCLFCAGFAFLLPCKGGYALAQTMASTPASGESFLVPGVAEHLIKWLHAIPRLLLREKQSEALNFRFVPALPFSPTDTSAGGYWESIIGTALCPAVLGIALLSVLLVWASCRVVCCCKSNAEQLKRSYRCHVNTLLMLLGATTVTALVGLIGYAGVETGFLDLSSGVDQVTHLLVPARAVAEETAALDNNMLANLNNMRSCSVWPPANRQLDAMKAEVNQFGRELRQVAVSTNETVSFLLELDVPKFLSKYDLLRRVVFIFPLACVVGVGLCSYATTRLNSANGLRFTFVCFAPVCILVLMLSASFEIGGALVLSDVCIDPQKVTLDVVSNTVGKNSLVLEAFAFYTTCAGTNPIQSKLTTANITLAGFDSKLEEWAAFCDSTKSDPAVVNLQRELTEALGELNRVSELIECSPIQSVWNTVVGSGLCNSAVSGFTILAVTQTLCASPWLFLCTIAASFTWRRLPHGDEHKTSSLNRAPAPAAGILPSGEYRLLVNDSMEGERSPISR